MKTQKKFQDAAAVAVGVLTRDIRFLRGSEVDRLIGESDTPHQPRNVADGDESQGVFYTIATRRTDSVRKYSFYRVN